MEEEKQKEREKRRKNLRGERRVSPRVFDQINQDVSHLTHEALLLPIR